MKKTLATLLAMVSLNAFAQKQQMYFASGLLQYSYELKDGKLDGKFTSYYDNGLMKTNGHFVAGKKSGVWQVWDNEGMLRIKRSFNENSVDLVGEWNKSGCHVDALYLEGKQKIIDRASGFKNYDDIFYTYRYWKSIQPSKENEAIFSTDFISYLQKEITAGRIVAFSDDRFVNPIKQDEWNTWIYKNPDAFLVKEDHQFSLAEQVSKVRIIGVGLCFGQNEERKIAWLYFPDLRKSTADAPLASNVIAKIENEDLRSSIDMTNFQAKKWDQPIKPTSGEQIYIHLAEIEMEATSWIYLLDRDLAAKN